MSCARGAAGRKGSERGREIGNPPASFAAADLAHVRCASPSALPAARICCSCFSLGSAALHSSTRRSRAAHDAALPPPPAATIPILASLLDVDERWLRRTIRWQAHGWRRGRGYRRGRRSNCGRVMLSTQCRPGPDLFAGACGRVATLSLPSNTAQIKPRRCRR